jgi:hypothetical protein
MNSPKLGCWKLQNSFCNATKNNCLSFQVWYVLPIHINPKYQKEIGHVKLTYRFESPWNTLDLNVAQLSSVTKYETPN